MKPWSPQSPPLQSEFPSNEIWNIIIYGQLLPQGYVQHSNQTIIGRPNVVDVKLGNRIPPSELNIIQAKPNPNMG